MIMLSLGSLLWSQVYRTCFRWIGNAETLEETLASLYDVDMTKVKALEKEVAKLSRKELAAFRTWFQEYDAEIWDKQIEQDAKDGKLDKLFKKALADHKAGKSTKL